MILKGFFRSSTMVGSALQCRRDARLHMCKRVAFVPGLTPWLHVPEKNVWHCFQLDPKLFDGRVSLRHVTETATQQFLHGASGEKLLSKRHVLDDEGLDQRQRHQPQIHDLVAVGCPVHVQESVHVLYQVVQRITLRP